MVLATLDGPTSGVPGRRRNRRLGRQSLWIWLLLTPTIVFYGVYTVYPIIASYFYSLVDWNGFEAHKTFVGLQNFRDVIADPLFWNSFKVTILFIVAAVPLKVILTLLLALLLNSPKMPFATFFRTIYFLPVVTTAAIVGVVMQFVFDPGSGPIVQLLSVFGFDGQLDLLGSSRTALWTAAGIHIWKWFGITLVYWLAALQTVPEEVYEAAHLDGAGTWGLFRWITAPLLKPFTIIITLLSFEEALRVFDLILTLTDGGPFFSTEVVEVYIYRWAFAATVPQLGYASAVAVIFGLFVSLVGVFQLVGVRALQKARTAQ